MTLITNFPLRQKVVILLTVSVGVFILIAYNLSLVSQEILNLIIFSYGLAVPMILLSFDTLVDLDKKKCICNLGGNFRLFFDCLSDGNWKI